MLLAHGAIVALVDGKNLELHRNAGTEAAPALAPVAAPRLDARNHSGGSHHSSAGNHAGHLVEEDAHAIAVAEWLNGEVLGHRIDSLVVIAAPRTLGEMRRHYHKQTGRVIAAELAKDLIGKEPRDILDALREKR